MPNSKPYLQAYQIQKSILQGNLATAEIIEIFKQLQSQKISREQFLGFLRASKDFMSALDTSQELLDVCGTGGDGFGTFNVSTLVSIVCATAGIGVAKHGNRASSGKCGGMDVLELAGLNLQASREVCEQSLVKNKLAFLFAPLYHPAFRFAKEARLTYGKKTYFNFLGPLLNPAKAKYQLVGVSDTSMIEVMGPALLDSGSQRVWLINSEEGLDEASPQKLTHIVSFDRGLGRQEFSIRPQDLGLKPLPLSSCISQDPQQSLQIFWSILKNQATPAQKQMVALNTALAMTVFDGGKPQNIQQNLDLALELLSGDLVKRKFEEVVEFCR